MSERRFTDKPDLTPDDIEPVDQMEGNR